MDSVSTTFDNWCHEERKKIDACIQDVKKVSDQRPVKGGAEITLAYRALQMAKMWIGKALEEFGSELPEQFRDQAKNSS